ncbi:MAG: dihydropyrimidinase [Sphaerochaetaceae bacterium]|jgi:dihydropyrimidinase|nr:dihydropyrimidinase [Sphaerochaetaceae bacterium]NLY07368.1 dihydropyrimidinase [Spirochaetales bacterium]
MIDLLIKGGIVVDGDGQRQTDVLIKDSCIREVGPDIKPAGECRVINAGGMYVMPGMIDAHTHYHLVSRGTVTADSFPEGSRCAAFGGVTAVVDFADHDKKTSLLGSTKERLQEMKGQMAVDYALHEGVYGMKDQIELELEHLKDFGVTAIKLFTTYKNVGYMIDNPDELDRLFSCCRSLKIMVCVHCEADDLIQKINESWNGSYLPKDHALLRPAEVEARGIQIVGELALKHHMPLYIVHLSSEKGLSMVRNLRSRGAHLVVETTPHYLFLDRSKLEGPKGPLYVMTPPLRDREDNLALQGALVNGEIQVVATDHCSFTYEQKLESHDCRTIYPGIPGTEELFVLLHTFAVQSGRIPVEKAVSLVTENPARAFGLYPRKGAIKPGSDGDVVIFDPREEWVISNKNIHSASGYSVYDGFHVMGKVKMTIRRGEILVENGQYFGKPGSGVFLKAGASEYYSNLTFS